MTLPNGTDAVSGDIFSFQQYIRFKNHWRQADPCTNLADPQSGMIASDSDDEKLYHYQAAAWVEILQVGVVIDGNIHVGDDIQLIFGADSDASIQYEETTNDALIFGIPVTPARGMIICDIADIGVDFSGLITATAQPNMFMVDLDNDSYMAIGYAGDDLPGIYSNRALYLQYAVAQDVEFFAGLAAGNPSIKISGWDANAAALDTYSINAGMDAGVGTRLTFGLDEVMRCMVICDYGDIAADFGLVAQANPRLYVFDADCDSFIRLGHSADDKPRITLSAAGSSESLIYKDGEALHVYNAGSNQDIINTVGRYFRVIQQRDLTSSFFAKITTDANADFTSTNAEQAFFKLEPQYRQTGTASGVSFLVDATEHSVGSGGHKLMDLRVATVSKFSVDNAGYAKGGTLSAALADDDTFSTTIPDSWTGIVIVENTTDSTSGVYHLDATAITAINQNAALTVTQGTNDKINVYVAGNVLTVENTWAAAKTVKVMFYGT